MAVVPPTIGKKNKDTYTTHADTEINTVTETAKKTKTVAKHLVPISHDKHIAFLVSAQTNATSIIATPTLVPNDDTSDTICENFCPPTQVLNSDKAETGAIAGVIGNSVTVTCTPGWSGSGTTVCGSNLEWNNVLKQENGGQKQQHKESKKLLIILKSWTKKKD